MRTVNIAELKDKLSSFLHQVRAGEELVIRDRNLPIAKIVPLHGDETDPEELPLIASGQMTLPEQKLNVERFWATGSRLKKTENLSKLIEQAITADRQEYGGILGHKRNDPHLRARTKRTRG